MGKLPMFVIQAMPSVTGYVKKSLYSIVGRCMALLPSYLSALAQCMHPFLEWSLPCFTVSGSFSGLRKGKLYSDVDMFKSWQLLNCCEAEAEEKCTARQSGL